MTYVRANTAPNFGQRAQALSPMASRLGYYFRSGFPLPTTSMSRPMRLGGLSLGDPGAFYDGPYPAYPQPEASRTRDTATPQLSGEWVPPTPPGRALFSQGAVTYRINPATGQYEFRSTDILPRGIWEQNTFQHPVRPALSALGVPVAARGVSLVQIGGRTAVMKTNPAPRRRANRGGLFGDGCGCGCRGVFSCTCRRLGADECSDDSDCGPGGTCGAGVCFSPPTPGSTSVANCTPGQQVNDPILGPVPCGSSTQPIVPVSAGAGALQQLANAANAVVNRNAPPVQRPQIQLPNWLTSSTTIAGNAIPNILLAGVGLVAIASMGHRGGRR